MCELTMSTMMYTLLDPEAYAAIIVIIAHVYKAADSTTIRRIGMKPGELRKPRVAESITHSLYAIRPTWATVKHTIFDERK